MNRPSTVDPALALRWLSQARRGVVLAQTLLLAIAWVGTDVRPPLTPLVALLGGLAAFDFAERRRTPTARRVIAHAAVDLSALTGILLVTGGAQNPLQAFYLVEVALLAIVLPGRAAWAATGAALVLQAAATLLALDIPGFDEEPHHHLGHLAGHVLAFDLAAVAVTAFVGRLSAALREREAALRASEAERAHGERLAALGTLAAGTAHALGTPLGAIELLGEELAIEPSAETLGTLRGEVRRCRAILDRMLAGDGGADGSTDRIGERVAAWVEAWRAGQPDEVRVTLVGEPILASVLGGEDGWRDATWTVLDNARAAGEPIRVTTRLDAGRVVVAVEDSGLPVPAERLARAGQPFFSAWPGRKGTGLGLYVARTFARAASGDVMLEPCADTGTRAILSMAVEGP
ncbi:MAG: HAMP domain-containing sensor histidine kinase [Myxococcota bacterium]